MAEPITGTAIFVHHSVQTPKAYFVEKLPVAGCQAERFGYWMQASSAFRFFHGPLR